LNKGKNLIEMLLFYSDTPHENVIELEFGKKIFKYDPGKKWFTELIVPQRDPLGSEMPIPEDAEIPVSGWMEVERKKKQYRLFPLSSMNLKIPSLRNKKLKILGKIPTLIGVKPQVPKLIKVKEPVYPQIEIPQPKKETELPPFPNQVVLSPAQGPVRRKVKVARVEPELTGIPKPLKIIRRRREEAPKIFETTVKVFPKAMLEGTKSEIGQEEEAL